MVFVRNLIDKKYFSDSSNLQIQASFALDSVNNIGIINVNFLRLSDRFRDNSKGIQPLEESDFLKDF
jgi:hypothetical protein